MSRHLYRQMAQARGTLNNLSRRPVTEAELAEEIATSKREMAESMAEQRARDAARVQKVRHPRIESPEYKCFRVIRGVLVNGELEIETIGAFKSVGDAILMLGREEGWAFISSPNYKRLYYNGQPMEKR